MPLKVNVGLSRKVGEANYGSRGASVHVEAELDAGLVADPPRLQEKIRLLFDLARASVAEELHHRGEESNGNGVPHNGDRTVVAHGSQHTNGHGAGNGNGNGTSRPTGNRLATQSQVKALHAISRSRGLDLHAVLHERFRLHRAEDLSLKEASNLIDRLKAGEMS